MVFNLFFFGKKEGAFQRYSLKKIPLFSTLNDFELSMISKRVRFIEYRKGDTIYKQGEEADAFYAIVTGRCRVYTINNRNEQRSLAVLHPGDYFGEVSLLAEKPHTANVEAKNDTLLIKINRKDFLDMMHSLKAFQTHVTRRLGLHMKRLYDVEIPQVDSKIVSVITYARKDIEEELLINIAASVKHETKQPVLVIMVHNEKPQGEQGPVQSVSFDAAEDMSYEVIKKHMFLHMSGVHYLSIAPLEKGEHDAKCWAGFLTNFFPHYKYIMVNIPASCQDDALPIVQQSDMVYVIGKEGTGEHDVHQLAHGFAKKCVLAASDMRMIIIDQKAGSHCSGRGHYHGIKGFVVPWETSSKEEPVSYVAVPLVLATPHMPMAKIIRYIAREMGGKLVGLVLGSGAAFGLAHIGVLKVLEREGIQVDIVSGCSIGAVIGSLWAAGLSAFDIEKLALSFTQKRNLLELVDITDISAPHFGFVKGKTVTRFLRKHLGDIEFKDLKIPLRIVATNVQTSEDVIFSSGVVVDAVRASLSIPGFVKPLSYKDTLLIDGGVTNPLPVNILTQEGIDKIIAVNVLPSTQDILEAQRCQPTQHTIPPKKSWLSRLGERICKHYRGNILNVMMNTVQYLEAVVASMQQSEADVIIHPIVCNSHWAQFHEPAKFIACGEAKTQEVLSEVKRLIEE